MRSRFTMLLCVTGATLIAIGCQQKRSTTTSDESVEKTVVATETPQQVAIAARDALLKQLSSRLVAAMSNGGPAAAIEVCSKEASRIAEAVGNEHDVSIGRTSFKLRNAANTPPPWAQSFVEARSQEAEFTELANGGTGALFPIQLKVQCLTCHGPTDDLDPKVRAKLTELYPDDQATGFQEGDLRGWFWVEVGPESAQAAPAEND